MDAAQWPQGIGVVKPIVEAQKPVNIEKKPRPPKEQALNCPRCNSTNTKFCYYNNYSLTQPRYFCKTCRRYWTEGGSLRSVPVGGGSRKNKRSSTNSSSPTSSKKTTPDLTNIPTFLHSQNPKIIHGATTQDLNLSYPPSRDDHYSNSFSSLLALQQKPNSSRGLNSFMPMPMPIPADCSTIYNSSSGLPLHDFKPTLNFSLDGFENGYGNLDQNVQETNAKLFFPMEDLKQVSNGEFDHHQQNRGQGDHQQSSNGYWNGMLGGSSW